MKIVYAPSAREQKDNLHANVICAFEIEVLETLALVGGSVLYLPHEQTPKAYTKIVLDCLRAYPIKLITSLAMAKKSDCLVSDLSNRIFEYSLSFQKPSIVFLSGVSGISLSQDKFYKLLESCAHFAHSLAELQNTCLHIGSSDKPQSIAQFIKGEFL